MKTAILSVVALLIISSVSQTPPVPAPARRGMTWVVLNWPTPDNNLAGSVGCGPLCGPYTGDTFCTDSIPLLCIIGYKTLTRPLYYYQKRSPASGGFYNGWTGGYFAATPPTVGTLLASKIAADNICKKYFGPSALLMQHFYGRYMNYMNDEPLTWSKWNWNLTQSGGWTGWGYFQGKLPCTKMWTWGDPNVNCGN